MAENTCVHTKGPSCTSLFPVREPRDLGTRKIKTGLTKCVFKIQCNSHNQHDQHKEERQINSSPGISNGNNNTAFLNAKTENFRGNDSLICQKFL